MLKPEKYIQYFEKNRAKVGKTIARNGITTTVAYLPVDYCAARDVCFDTSLTVDSALKRYENSVLFIVTLESPKTGTSSFLLTSGGIGEFKDNVMRNSFGITKNVFLLRGEDTVKAESCHYERNWGVGSMDVFVFAFSKKKIKTDLKNYTLTMRDIVPEIGTVDCKVRNLLKLNKKLKG